MDLTNHFLDPLQNAVHVDWTRKDAALHVLDDGANRVECPRFEAKQEQLDRLAPFALAHLDHGLGRVQHLSIADYQTRLLRLHPPGQQHEWNVSNLEAANAQRRDQSLGFGGGITDKHQPLAGGVTGRGFGI